MGENSSFERAKLVLPMLVAPKLSLPSLRSRLTGQFGPIDRESTAETFAYTDYYTPEMGPHLCRIFVSFERLVDPETLADIKLTTNGIEREYAVEGSRTVNLDPGILTLSRFILATTKDHAHRIPLRDGIYGEITLMFRNGMFEPLEWTYPDYRSESYRNILSGMRNVLHQQQRAAT